MSIICVYICMSQASSRSSHTGFPGKFESSDVSRDNVSRRIGRKFVLCLRPPRQGLLTVVCLCIIIVSMIIIIIVVSIDI